MDQINAIVTGGTRGIGLGLAEALVKRGVSVAVTYSGSDTDAEVAESRLNSKRLVGKSGEPFGEQRVMVLKPPPWKICTSRALAWLLQLIAGLLPFLRLKKQKGWGSI